MPGTSEASLPGEVALAWAKFQEADSPESSDTATVELAVLAFHDVESVVGEEDLITELTRLLKEGNVGEKENAVRVAPSHIQP